MRQHLTLGLAAGFLLGVLPGVAMAQSVSVSRSVLENQPYTLIYPDPMVASGGLDAPVVINHPDAPLQCSMSIVPVEDSDQWTAEAALASLDDGDVTAGWAESFPGFTLMNKSVVEYQSGPALLYDGTSTDSPMGMPLTIVHTETVDSGRGYTLDCYYDTAGEAQLRPLVDFIIANFSTSSGAGCCVGAEPETAEDATASPQ
jgi:hypothetical protein